MKKFIVIAATLAIANSSPVAQPFYAHGNIQLLNDGTYRDLVVAASGRGNGIALWCQATNQWQLHKIPRALTIIDIADNGTGGVRITHSGGRPLATGLWVTMRGIGGVNTTPYGIGVLDNPAAAGARRITVINETQFDVDGFTFAGGSYSGGSVVDPVIAAHVDHVTIDGTPHQRMPETLTAYLVGLRFADAACTMAELVLDSVRSGRWADYTNLNKDPDTGINLLPSYDKVPLIGMVTRSPQRHVQGNANCIFVLNWYHPEPLRIVATYVGGTNGANNTEVSMSPYIPDGRLAWLTWRGRLQNVKGVLHVTSTSAADITARIAISRGGGSTFMSKAFAIRRIHPA